MKRRIPSQHAVEARFAQEAVIDRRHTRHHRDAGEVVEDRLDPRIGDQTDRGASSQQWQHRREDAVGHQVEVEEHVVRPDPPGVADRGDVPDHLPDRDHRPLGTPGGPRGVDDRVRRVGREIHLFAERFGPGDGAGKAPHGAGVEREDRGKRSRDNVGKGRITDDERRRRVLEDQADLGPGEAHMHRQRDGADPRNRQIEHQRIGRLLHHQRDDVAPPDPRGAQRAALAGGDLVHLGVADVRSAVAKDKGAALVRHRASQGVEHIRH